MVDKDIEWENRIKEHVDKLVAERKGGGREHLVSIVHQNGCCKVEPAVLHASPGDTIFWQFDGSAANEGLLFFPKEGLFTESFHKIPSPPEESKGLPMLATAKRGKYPYAVYCKTHNCFAVGNSDPRLEYP